MAFAAPPPNVDLSVALRRINTKSRHTTGPHNFDTVSIFVCNLRVHTLGMIGRHRTAFSRIEQILFRRRDESAIDVPIALEVYFCDDNAHCGHVVAPRSGATGQQGTTLAMPVNRQVVAIDFADHGFVRKIRDCVTTA